MSSNGSENVKHSEAMSDDIITAMSTACGASVFLFELLKKKTRKQFVRLPARVLNSRPSRFPIQYTNVLS